MPKRAIKVALSLLVWLSDRLGDFLSRLTGRPAKERTVILYYHAVPADQRGLFARQMDLVRSIATPVHADPRRRTPGAGLRIAVTFDDGFVSVVENALPELRERGIPFTVFFPTGSWGTRPGWIRDSRHPSWHERVLSREELVKFAADPLVTIASHSINHPNFLRLEPAQADTEFRESRAALEEVLRQPVDLFSFPHGAHDADLVRRAYQAGYIGVYTVEPSFAPQANGRFVAGRVATNPDDWPLEFRLKASGAYRWQTWLRKPVIVTPEPR